MVVLWGKMAIPALKASQLLGIKQKVSSVCAERCGDPHIQHHVQLTGVEGHLDESP